MSASLTLEDATRVITAAIAKARAENMQPLGIMVLDAGGHPVAFQREDGATFIRFGVAQAKAWTALSLGSSSRAFQELAEARPNFATSLTGISEGKMAASAGGILLEKDGQVVGAIGISGDLPDNDEIASKAGAAAL